MRDWIARTGIRLEQLRVFAREERVVVEQRATWSMQGAPPSTQVIGSAFRISGEVVASVVRYDSLEEALAAAGLGPEDEIHG